MGLSITKRYLTTKNNELCQKFVNWLKELFAN
jgi:hypothetical protein